MATLREKIRQLEFQISILNSKIVNLSRNTEDRDRGPYSQVGGLQSRAFQTPVDINTGLGDIYGGFLAWNNSELTTAYGDQPDTPNVGYNKHSHSRYSGGALDIGTLEFVEYKTDEDGNIIDPSGTELNRHSQQFWTDSPKIVTAQNSEGENVQKLGTLALVFNADTKKWGTTAYEIDVKKTYLVIRDEEGNIMTDENGVEMKSTLYNEDQTKSSIIWDKNAQVWRFLAVYAEEIVVETEEEF